MSFLTIKKQLKQLHSFSWLCILQITTNALKEPTHCEKTLHVRINFCCASHCELRSSLLYSRTPLPETHGCALRDRGEPCSDPAQPVPEPANAGVQQEDQEEPPSSLRQSLFVSLELRDSSRVQPEPRLGASTQRSSPHLTGALSHHQLVFLLLRKRSAWKQLIKLCFLEGHCSN